MVDGLEYDAGIASGDLQVLDATEAMGRYISASNIPGQGIKVYDWDGGAKGAELREVAGLNGTFEGNDFVYPRANLINANGIAALDDLDENGKPHTDLTDCTIEFGSPCIQPFRGAEAALDAGNVTLPGDYIKGTADEPALEGEF